MVASCHCCAAAAQGEARTPVQAANWITCTLTARLNFWAVPFLDRRLRSGLARVVAGLRGLTEEELHALGSQMLLALLPQANNDVA
jgi:uncharacterized NAD(P)/FAD-binding protein YdhS